MNPLPTVIKKHPIGIALILLVGLGTTALIWATLYSLHRTGDLDSTTTWMMLFASIVVLLITVIQLWVYSLSYIELTDDGIHIVNWRTLFVKTDVMTEWSKIQDVTVSTGSIWPVIFNFGTLTIQTAGTAQELNMTMVGNAEYWQAIIQAEAQAAV